MDTDGRPHVLGNVTATGQRPGTRAGYAVLIISAAVPALILLLAGAAKLDDPFPAALFLRSVFGVPFSTAVSLTKWLATAELAAAATLLLCLGRSRIPAFVATGLFSLFIGLLLRLLLTQPNASTCGCFGNLFGDLWPGSLWMQCAFDVIPLALSITHVLVTPACPKCRVRGTAPDSE
jgi:hypothetical protein